MLCRLVRAGVFAALLLFPASSLLAQLAASVPQLSSRPGAQYTIYLNVAGFDYDGLWYDHATAPGLTLGVNDRTSAETFDAAEVEQIKNIWSRTAQSYIGFNVNVTTIDPAIAALGPGATDAQRQAYYDATPNLMHTVVGSQIRNPADYGPGELTAESKWFDDGADGVSPGIGVVAGVAGGPGQHTNWMFSEAQAGAATAGVINGDYIGAISAHENAHSFGLYHQGDWTGSTLVNEYSLGDDAAGPDPGTYVPIIGQASDRQRVTWRVGDTHPDDVQTVQNDVQLMLSINVAGNGRAGAVNLHLIDDGIGHSLGAATELPLVGSVIDVTSSSSKGVIVPLSEANPAPIGASNYTEDWFSFYTDGGDAISLTVNNSTDFLTAGVADGVGTLRSTLMVFDAMGTMVGMGMEDVSTLFVSYSELLGAGSYFAKVGSFGGHEQDSSAFNAAQYFDMGAFFLTGSGFDVAAVPEPGTLVLLAVGGLALVRRRRS
ncbi:PEP-CTERM motif protein [Pirellulimonas nuda]|uniref:PEP-CTERM motif protein n=1 Tax=Pirellulimonas nuda TaxID=2528009 RepID=A0A518D7T0_9BACT|nr:PEP-CTERM sorting domain-containing protein [Pirellulimonas nuda]QDU87516.1 PEP-CTERM motif protein [Pirellulimonas nuda]